MFDYWHDRVRLKNYELITASGHVKTQDHCLTVLSITANTSLQQTESISGLGCKEASVWAHLHSWWLIENNHK
ncbi:MAG: hypothetical protein V7K50_18500 [Nostoc sp.]|uniref:hypothetical protein n=1 Tax=Nostoc sp. TaxID=1180 RepID=UPI002FFB5E2A